MPAQRIGEPVVDVEERANVDRVLDRRIGKSHRAERSDIGGAHLFRPQRQFFEKAERRAQLRVERRAAPVIDHCFDEPVILQGQRRDRGVRLRSEDALIEL